MTDTISLSDAAYLLRQELGPIRNWVAFLNDINRGKSVNVHGLILEQCARLHDGLAYRPRYDVQDVRAFIMEVREANPAAKPADIEIKPLPVDKRLSWRLNKFDQVGRNVKRVIGHAYI